MILILMLSLAFNSYSQQFKSQMSLIKEVQIKDAERETNIEITASEIIIKKYKNNGAEDLTRIIERIETKPYNGALCTWYYCISGEKDLFNKNYRKSIFIHDKAGRSLLFADFASEVDVYWRKFFL